jgi:hypothetical protein
MRDNDGGARNRKELSIIVQFVTLNLFQGPFS